MAEGPTLADGVVRRAYALGHRALRPWWRLSAPLTRGAFTALWSGRRVLLVQNGYVDFRTLPGGGIAPGESPREAAVRECKEEVGIRLEPEQLTLVEERPQIWFGRHDHVWVFEGVLAEHPTLRIDHREVVDARWVPPEVALAGPLFPPVRRYLEACGAGPRGGD